MQKTQKNVKKQKLEILEFGHHYSTCLLSAHIVYKIRNKLKFNF